ncbi:MAG: hypothetical protein ACOYXW_06560 [Actinomycetota bacterium]
MDLEALIAAAEGFVAAGSDDLASALDEFDDRWERGVNNLMGDVAEIGGRLGETAMEYLETERRVAARFAALGAQLEQLEQRGRGGAS